MQEIEIASVAFATGKSRKELYDQYRKEFVSAEPYVPKEEKLDKGAFDRLKGFVSGFGGSQGGEKN